MVRLSLALIVLLASGARAQELTLYRGDHRAMGTVYSIFLYSRDAATAQSALSAAFDEVDRVDDLLSNYKAQSEISRINREAATHPVTTDPETFAFVQAALNFSRLTDGAFDITVGKLLKTWGFFEHKGAVPDQARRQADAAAVGWQHVRLDPATRSVSFVGSMELELDPGGIGKGYAVDRVVAVLRALHVDAALISAGSSSVYAMGAPPHKAGWSVKIPDPRAADAVLQTIEVRDTSVSTSACTAKFFVEQGHLYCHIFDPRTLLPVEGMLQTTIISPRGIDSDALSTGLFVTTSAQSKQILGGMPDVSALIVAGDKSSATLTLVRWPHAAEARQAFDNGSKKGGTTP